MKKIQVFYQDRVVGSLVERSRQTGFEYDPSFLDSGINLSPLVMPLGKEVYWGDQDGFHYLPPLLSDSMPDSFGQFVMAKWFVKHHGPDFRPTAVDKLSYVGSGGMGALTYQPVLDSFPKEVLRLIDLRQQEQESRALFSASGPAPDVIDSLKRKVLTVGGSFPKALVAIDPKTGQMFEEDSRISSDFEHWIVKFGTPAHERDSLRNHPEIEYAFGRLQRDAGIAVPRMRLVTTKDEKTGVPLNHLLIERFDRKGSSRIHCQSLSALVGLPAKDGTIDYLNFLDTAWKLTKRGDQVEEVFRRMVFNALSNNLDDHGKNHAFLYQGGEWSISPAFDVTFEQGTMIANQVQGRAMAISGNILAPPDRRIFEHTGNRYGVDHQTCRDIMEQVRSSMSQAGHYLKEAGLPSEDSNSVQQQIDRNMRTVFPQTIVSGIQFRQPGQERGGR